MLKVMGFDQVFAIDNGILSALCVCHSKRQGACVSDTSICIFYELCTQNDIYLEKIGNESKNMT